MLQAVNSSCAWEEGHGRSGSIARPAVASSTSTQRPGRLVKCYKARIVKDYTHGDPRCPECGQAFAREAMIRGRPAYKIIQGKVIVRD